MNPIQEPPREPNRGASSPVGASGSYVRSGYSGYSGYSGGSSGATSLVAGVMVLGLLAALLYGGWQLLRWIF